ncbi:DUF4913 domain-containing protein [Nocardia takedensis]|uniref:DUF4913 domain-containing protein n=1 Tax=Nocardia takedensis TaxID=259390 RepID=UPI0002F807B3|nr:DUF4913 domain-containing protein [Nocardia takedensis]
MSEATDNPAPTEDATAAQAVVAQMDLGALLDSATRKAVTAQVNAAAKEIAEGVVADLLTPEVVAGVRETAVNQANAALSPTGAEPEPAPEPAAAADGEAEEPKRELRFKTLADFVERYVAQVWRREVSEFQSEKYFRWCPDWHEHGEVVARMEALWAAFEHLRLGETTEMSEFWLSHFGPHMAAILNPQGPFRHCSVEKGHSAELGPLPCKPISVAVNTEGHYTERPSGLFVPTDTGKPLRRRVEMAWPE